MGKVSDVTGLRYMCLVVDIIPLTRINKFRFSLFFHLFHILIYLSFIPRFIEHLHLLRSIRLLGVRTDSNNSKLVRDIP